MPKKQIQPIKLLSNIEFSMFISDYLCAKFKLSILNYLIKINIWLSW